MPRVRFCNQLRQKIGVVFGNQKAAREKVNDAIDFDVLFAVSLPAIICTSDRAMRRVAEKSQAADARFVVTRDELLQRLRNEGAAAFGASPADPN